jgi:LEA14-like dessication related protein
MRRYLVLGSIAMLATVSGCSALGKAAFAEPVVTLQDVQLKGIGLNGGAVDVVLNVYNPNNYRLDATRVRYNLLFDSTRVANGEITERQTVEGKDTLRVNIPVNFTFSGIGAAARQLLSQGSVPYRVTGDVVVGSPVGNFTVPFSKSGRFSSLGGVR